MARPILGVFVTLLVLLATGVPTDARIYLRWGSAKSTPDVLETIGGTLAYEADIRINAGPGHLYVYGFEGSLLSHLPNLQRQFKAAALAPGKTGSSEMRMVTLERDGGVLRLVLVNLANDDKSIVFAMEQSQDAYAQSSRPPDLSTLQDLGPLPQADPVFYARDERAGMSLLVQETGSSPAGMHAAFATHLRAEGWLPAMPDVTDRPGSPERFGVYVKGDNTCVSLSTRDPHTGMTRITVLHKEPGIE